MVTVVVKASRLRLDTGTYQRGDVIEIEEDIYLNIRQAVTLVKASPEIPVTNEEIVEAEALADRIVAEEAADEAPAPQAQVEAAITEAETEASIARAKNGRGKKKVSPK